MKSFQQLIGSSNEEVKSARVTNVVRTTSTLSKQEIESGVAKLQGLENDIEQLLDICPDSSIDLNSNLKNFDPNEFVQDLYTKSVEIYELYKKIQVRINVHNMLFPENQCNSLTEYDKDFIKSVVGDLV